MKEVALAIPEGAIYKPYYSVAIQGTGWTLADNFEFINEDNTSEGLGNVSGKNELEKNSDVVIFGLNLVVDPFGDTPAISQNILRYLTSYGYLQFKKGNTTVHEIPSRLIPAGNGPVSHAALDASAASATFWSGSNGVAAAENYFKIPGGFRVKQGDKLSVLQKFLANTGGTAPLTYINTNNTQNLLYMLIMHAFV
jgi:hypothetical protein